VNGVILAEVEVPTAMPGSYSSADASTCGTVQLGFDVRDPPARLSYQAGLGTMDCLAEPQRTTGTWSVDITAVGAGGGGDAGMFDTEHYPVHGAFNAQLPGGGSLGDAGPGSVSVSVRF
jgi:hypothetical protein